MKDDFIEKLTEITEEEKEILQNKQIKKSYYTDGVNFIVQGKNILKGKTIDLRLHSRFCDFPLHNHDYMEIMYVYSGQITHIIDKKEICLKKGDMIFLNKHIQHEIKKADKDDIGINFILSDTFLSSTLQKIDKEGILAHFIETNFKKEISPQYLHYSIGEIFPIRNLLDNLIYSIIENNNKVNDILSLMMTLLFEYLSLYKESLIDSNFFENEQSKLRSKVLTYIKNNYKTATLLELSKITALSLEYLSRKIKATFNKNFKELLMEQRMLCAEKLLLTTKMKTEDIIESIGYENSSYFFRLFKEKHNTTPKKWRDLKQKNG